MNTKVIFYGNCQLGELSIRMHYELGFRDSFRVILPGDYGVDLSGEEGYSFARYLFFTSKKNPICPRALNSAFSDADVAFLHNVSAETFGEESSSKAICSKYASCKKIFVTNFWFDPYCQVDEIITKLFFSGIREPQEVLDFMLHEYDPFIEKSVFEKYKNQVEKLEVKEKACLKISDIHISLLTLLKKDGSKKACAAIMLLIRLLACFVFCKKRLSRFWVFLSLSKLLTRYPPLEKAGSKIKSSGKDTHLF